MNKQYEKKLEIGRECIKLWINAHVNMRGHVMIIDQAGEIPGFKATCPTCGQTAQIEAGHVGNVVIYDGGHETRQVINVIPFWELPDDGALHDPEPPKREFKRYSVYVGKVRAMSVGAYDVVEALAKAKNEMAKSNRNPGGWPVSVKLAEVQP
jgi:hypothetical protein